MARMVPEIAALVNAIIGLEHDAIDALALASRRLSSLCDKAELGAMLADHRRHVAELSEVVRAYGAQPTSRGDARRLVAKGRVLFRAPFGDEAIVAAAATNEAMTLARYERLAVRVDLPPHVAELVRRHLGDEHGHCATLAARCGEPPPKGARAEQRR